MTTLTDSFAVVAGADNPIGQATVAELSARGARVLATGTDAQRLAEATNLDGVSSLVVDPTTPAGRAKLVAAAAGLTHLVITGGSSNSRPAAHVDEPYWDEIFARNARTTFFVCRDLIEQMPSGGAIVVVSSVAAKTSRNIEVTAYSAAEAAILSITRSFANAYAARGVRVNAICTGIIDTPDNAEYLTSVAASRGVTVEEVSRVRMANVPLRRAGSPAECATTIRCLLSDDTSFVTGQAINVTGGFHNY
jgi:NAD(P)-dependent dehydrogenase (short-subunit alcohol dehydrogenase family)